MGGDVAGRSRAERCSAARGRAASPAETGCSPAGGLLAELRRSSVSPVNRRGPAGPARSARDDARERERGRLRVGGSRRRPIHASPRARRRPIGGRGGRSRHQRPRRPRPLRRQVRGRVDSPQVALGPTVIPTSLTAHATPSAHHSARPGAHAGLGPDSFSSMRRGKILRRSRGSARTATGQSRRGGVVAAPILRGSARARARAIGQQSPTSRTTEGSIGDAEPPSPGPSGISSSVWPLDGPAIGIGRFGRGMRSRSSTAPCPRITRRSPRSASSTSFAIWGAGTARLNGTVVHEPVPLKARRSDRDRARAAAGHGRASRAAHAARRIGPAAVVGRRSARRRSSSSATKTPDRGHRTWSHLLAEAGRLLIRADAPLAGDLRRDPAQVGRACGAGRRDWIMHAARIGDSGAGADRLANLRRRRQRAAWCCRARSSAPCSTKSPR